MIAEQALAGEVRGPRPASPPRTRARGAEQRLGKIRAWARLGTTRLEGLGGQPRLPERSRLSPRRQSSSGRSEDPVARVSAWRAYSAASAKRSSA